VRLINGGGIGVVSTDLKQHLGEKIQVAGVVYKIRSLSKAVFVQLLDSGRLIQCIVTPEVFGRKHNLAVKEGDWIKITGIVMAEKQARAGLEIQVSEILPLNLIGSKEHEVAAYNFLSDNFKNNQKLRSLSLRNLRRRSILKIKGVLQDGFNDFFSTHHFIKINSPKIIFNGLEGGSKLFSVDYFGRRGYLSQSPQLYKQMMVGVFQRVFEIGPVFRANENKSSKQLCEFMALDVEFSPVAELSDTLSLCVSAMSHGLNFVTDKCKFEIDCLGVEIPKILNIPSITRDEALKILFEKGGEKDNRSIDHKDKIKLWEHFRSSRGSDFLFITNPPLSECDFYFPEDKDYPGSGKCWHLLFRGLDISGGGQRIHSYEEQKARMESLRMDISDFEQYLSAHSYGLPPHGGFSISIERLVMKLLNLSNIKEACLFPRDANTEI
jgi:aspartyl/asparaginyl-tRNA synthetase